MDRIVIGQETLIWQFAGSGGWSLGRAWCSQFQVSFKITYFLLLIHFCWKLGKGVIYGHLKQDIPLKTNWPVRQLKRSKESLFTPTKSTKNLSETIFSQKSSMSSMKCPHMTPLPKTVKYILWAKVSSLRMPSVHLTDVQGYVLWFDSTESESEGTSANFTTARVND